MKKIGIEKFYVVTYKLQVNVGRNLKNTMVRTFKNEFKNESIISNSKWDDISLA